MAYFRSFRAILKLSHLKILAPFKVFPLSFVPHGPMVKASGYDYVTTSGWNQKIPGSTPGGEAFFFIDVNFTP